MTEPQDDVGWKQKELEKAWKDFSDFTKMVRTRDNFDLFSCGYMRGRADQLTDSLKKLGKAHATKSR